ncbi:DNA polymerase III, beta subunit [Elusimicrobium minutum Pei191]|uniref:Beta sliding clamp n=1 Tax=Elusimicrobium minutum (strain Pei191) TaxID=445932 RepID=B2KAM5_ELUMP|nr:DNA polymerase III subunit beta [Elusimicrobium minutum]ACC97571.1 DNA polymerase III, beta subunit [Elusimicrobium minutum Pei191]
MKINITKETFLEGLSVVQAGVSSRATLPILHNFLMETENGKIKLVRTDMEMASIHYIKAEILEEGSVTIPLKEVSDILKNLPNDKEINLTVGEDNKVHIKSGKSKFWVIGTPKSEYPLIPEIDKSNLINLKIKEIQEMVEKTIFSSSTQETRYVLNGLLWVKTGNKFEVVATDGRRLALAVDTIESDTKDFKIIIPTKILNELLRFFSINKPSEDDTLVLSVASNQVSFNIKETTYISRLIEGNFPNYEQVIPNKKVMGFLSDTKEILASTKRASLCANELGGTVKYSLNNNVLKITSNSQKMDFSDEMKVEYTAEPFEISFNPQYVLDVLKNISTEKVEFSFINAAQPVLIEEINNTKFKYVIMPVRS